MLLKDENHTQQRETAKQSLKKILELLWEGFRYTRKDYELDLVDRYNWRDALIGMIIAENKKLKRENSLLKEQTTLTIDMRPNNDSYVRSNQNVVVVSASHDLIETDNRLKRGDFR